MGAPPAQATPTKATPAPASRGIEGTWLTPIGVVRIVKLGATYLAGTVVKPSAETRCKNAVGERVWTFSGSGGRYEGTASVWDSRKAACTPATATATWVVKGDRVSFVTHSRADNITSSSTLVRGG